MEKGFIAFMVICFFGVLAIGCGPMLVTGDATITVESKERGGDNKPALVFTDSETFEVSDSVLDGHFSSSDTYGRLKVGETYECSTRGVRIPLFSKWRNLVECEKA